MRILLIPPQGTHRITSVMTTEFADRLQQKKHLAVILPPCPFPRIRSFWAARRADLVLVVDAPLAGACWGRLLWRVPYVVIASTTNVERYRRWPVWPWLLRAGLRAAQRIVALNTTTRNCLLRFGAGRNKMILAAPPATVREGAPPMPVRPRILAMLLEDTPQTLSALLRTLDNVMEDIPTLELRLGGTSEALAPARERVERLGLEAHVHFAEPNEDILGSGGIAVAIAASGEPQHALFALDAAGACLPVAASATPELEDWLKDGQTALLVPTGDERALANGITRLLRAPHHATALAEAAQARLAARHTWDEFLETLLEP